MRADGNLCCFVGEKGLLWELVCWTRAKGGSQANFSLSEAAWKKDFYIKEVLLAVEIVCASVGNLFLRVYSPDANNFLLGAIRCFPPFQFSRPHKS
jgi:hypothetical protein